MYPFLDSQILGKKSFTPMILKFYKPSVKFFFLKFEATNSEAHHLCPGLQKQLCQ